MNLINCNTCNIVFKNNFETDSKNKYQIEDIKRNKYLKEKRNLILWYWLDIEQTEMEYLKFCPICNKVTTFKEIKTNEI